MLETHIHVDTEPSTGGPKEGTKAGVAFNNARSAALWISDELYGDAEEWEEEAANSEDQNGSAAQEYFDLCKLANTARFVYHNRYFIEWRDLAQFSGVRLYNGNTMDVFLCPDPWTCKAKPVGEPED